MSRPYWTRAQNARSKQQGWVLSVVGYKGDPSLYANIKRYGDRWSNDREARIYVKGRAAAGCKLAQAALRKHGERLCTKPEWYRP